VFSAADPIVYTVAQINMVSTLVSSAQIAATSAVASQSPSVSSLPTTLAQPTQSSQSSAASSSTSDSKMGIYVGVPLGVLLAIALAAIAFLVVKNRKLKRAQGQQYPSARGFAQNEKVPDYAHASELGTRPGELSDRTDVAVELPHGPK
jgi:beta-lactamase regulating signal transducer with metallopeptidase domain